MLTNKLRKELEMKKAKGAFLIEDLKTKEVWEYEPDKVVPSASLIKLFILTKAMSLVKEGEMSLDEKVAVSGEDVVAFSVLEFLRPRKYALEELLKLMIIYSDNTATNVLIDYLGMEQIDQHIRQIGYRHSKLQRKVMDIEAAAAGRDNLTTVGEMAHLLRKLYNNQLLQTPYDGDMLAIMRGQADECMMRVNLPDEIPIARKSGELDQLDHDVSIVYGTKTDYLYCFFVWDAKSNNDAREILANTSKIVYDFFEAK